jgi:Domain of unknown function (DUF4129)
MRVTVWRSVPKAIAATTAAAALWLVIAACWAVAAAAPPGPPGVDPAVAAREVFQGQDFWWKRIETKTVPTSWLQSILQAIAEFIGRIVRDIFEWIARLLAGLFRALGGGAGADSTSVWVIIAVVLAWAIWRLYPVIVRWLMSGPPAPTTDGVTWQTLPESADLYDQADRVLADGQYAEAIRLALLALIARLERRGLLRYDTSRTNREYQVELRHRTELAALFGQLARIYDRVWYGRVSADRADAERAIQLCGSAINREDLAPE